MPERRATTTRKKRHASSSCFYVFARKWGGINPRTFPIDKFNLYNTAKLIEALNIELERWINENPQRVEQALKRYAMQSAGQPFLPDYHKPAPTEPPQEPEPLAKFAMWSATAG